MRFIMTLGGLLAVSAALLAETAKPVPVVVDDAHIRAIDDHLTRAAKRGMNGSILIRRHGEVLLRKAYGVRDRENGEPLRLEHGFTIGSIVKPINAVGILKLDGS